MFNKTYRLWVDTRFESTGFNSLKKNPNMDIASANWNQWHTSTNQLLQKHQILTERRMIISGNIMSFTCLVHFSTQKSSLALLSSLLNWISCFKIPFFWSQFTTACGKGGECPVPTWLPWCARAGSAAPSAWGTRAAGRRSPRAAAGCGSAARSAGAELFPTACCRWSTNSQMRSSCRSPKLPGPHRHLKDKIKAA